MVHFEMFRLINSFHVREKNYLIIEVILVFETSSEFNRLRKLEKKCLFILFNNLKYLHIAYIIYCEMNT